MSWRDELRPASFRGVAFETRGHELGGGRRLARHEYPQRDEPYLEDMGKKAREYKVQAFVIGPDYRAARDALLEALEQSGPGELVHPFFGRRSVVAGEFGLKESTEEGGMATFSLVFTEAGKLAEPDVDIDLPAELLASQETAFDEVANDFAESFDVSGLPAWSLDDIEAAINDFLSLDAFKAVANEVSGFVSRVADLVMRPVDFANSVIGLVRRLTDVSSILSTPYMPVRAWRTQSVQAETTTRGVVAKQQAAVNMLFHRAALVQETATLQATDGPTALETRQQVEAARQLVLEHFDTHDVTPGLPRPAPALAAALKALQVNTLVYLRRQSAALPQVYALQLLEATPAVVLAYDLYQNLRADEIVRRNAVRHPGFVPAGVPLEVTSQ
ncbi:Mu-like prophage FluMu DNA circulation protein [Cupriavidus necator N-1]|uniref:Mu-like prophage FluMu DNA circulation protein n=1 Tax=Cupriavidus necator (strain ATCC 43291 / DSM 13513 / CCUG 52238 / LMG 8453 / N-1) TaxID=1042878 RepID=G0ER36_CUPNN|nr:DNA circularization N-terminal domain-containing protein [Cupriavidus necator]AEI76554.1 Mu-like prophage FluMu DNA circulation protein [Cupriavidus necator N-1]MDX6011323.1 DNA circularization N-terminal domain-containing protein [Cupriavidus necator]